MWCTSPNRSIDLLPGPATKDQSVERRVDAWRLSHFGEFKTRRRGFIEIVKIPADGFDSANIGSANFDDAWFAVARRVQRDQRLLDVVDELFPFSSLGDVYAASSRSMIPFASASASRHRYLAVKKAGHERSSRRFGDRDPR